MKQLFFFASLFFLFACSSGIKVANVEASPDADFSKYKTYGFYEVKASGDTISEGFTKRIGYLKTAISEEMSKRGFTPSSNPDLFINIGVVVKEEVQTRKTDWATEGRFTYMGQRNYRWESKEVETGRYRNGTVSVHVVDAAQRNMLWKGTAKGVVPEKEKNIPQAALNGMKELFVKFPVPAK
jgi:hypothetical protein